MFLFVSISIPLICHLSLARFYILYLSRLQAKASPRLFNTIRDKKLLSSDLNGVLTVIEFQNPIVYRSVTHSVF